MIALICFLIVGVCKAVSDTLADHYEQSVFVKWNPWFWNKKISWINKYRYDAQKQLKPKFPFSTTALVFLTDGWHLFNMIGHIFIFAGILALIFLTPNIYYALGSVFGSQAIGFNICYSWLFKKSVWNITKS